MPYTSQLAEDYAALDLPYGAPMDLVTARWKKYLKKCHPDFHAHNPSLLADANLLTRLLTEAYDRIREAWGIFLKGARY
ncbi:MAG: hypothetical protein V1742_08625 [Pseudomonadota bacterium]